MNEPYDLGLLIKNARKEKGLTQKRLAEKLGLSDAAVNKYEKNTAIPPFDVMIRISNLFNVSMDYLAGTEKPTDITYGLNQEQREIISMLAKSFRQKNEAIPKIKNITESQYAIIGRIAVELSKTEY